MTMQYVCVDIEADGPIPGDYSMIEVGAIVVARPEKGVGLWMVEEETTFFGQLMPITKRYDQGALNSIGRTRQETLTYQNAWTTMEQFWQWAAKLKRHGPIRFVSDNAGFDWMFVCWYFHHFIEDKPLQQRNPFGFSCDSLTSLYKGFKKNMRADFRRDGLRGNFPHTHNALDDARGNANALCTLLNRGLGLHGLTS